MSLTTMPGKSGPIWRRPCSALVAQAVRKPSSCSACSQPSATSGSSSMIRMVRSSVMAGSERKFEGEDGAAVRMVAAVQATTEIAQDAGGNGQTQAQAVAGRFGREERLEEALLGFVAEAGAMVANGQADVGVVAVPGQFDARLGLIVHRIEGIADQVDQHLLQPVGIAERNRLCGRTAAFNRGPAASQAGFEQAEGVIDGMTERDRG